MHLNEVRATAFGPLRGSSLQLAPGLNVVHGPNEAGKSSWFAATYAGLAGRRKARGRGTTTQTDFRNRHKPWSGSQWSAGVTLTLDDGVVLTLEHDLNKGESRIVDPRTGRVVPIPELANRLGMDLTTESTLDGTRLLGLNRDSARATIFTGQADVLRVLEDAKALQDFLERAATTEVADVTAEGALDWLVWLRSQHVGSESLGKKPLRARSEALSRARDLNGERRDRLVSLMEVIAQRQDIAIQLRQAKAEVARAERIERWADIRTLQQRIGQAETLSSQMALSVSAGTEIDEDRIRAATITLGTYESGTDVPALPEGATAAELEAEIAALPSAPEGDLEPRTDILNARDELTRAATALRTLVDGAPEIDPPVPAVNLTADELRTLADTLEEDAPVVDARLADELRALQQAGQAAAASYRETQISYEATLRRNEERRRAYAQAVEDHARLASEFESAHGDYLARQAEATQAAAKQASETRKRAALIAAGGALLLLVGVVVAAVGPPIVSIALALSGGAGLIVGLVVTGRRSRTPTHRTATADDGPRRPAPPRQPDLPQLEDVTAPVSPPINPRALDLQIELKAQENARRQHQEQRAATRARLLDESLDSEPDALRQLARSVDDADAARSRRRRHDDAEQVLRSERDNAVRALALALGEEVATVITDDVITRLERAVEAYSETCRQRAVIAREAARRTDLTAALAQRRQLEEDRMAAAVERERQETAVLDFVGGLDEGETESSIEAAATRLRGWLTEQQRGRTEHAARAQLATRLDQVLEGRALTDWHQDLAGLIETAGPEPQELPVDVETFRAQVTERHELVVSRAGALVGQQEQLSRGLGSVAEALEDEATAERALAEVQTLRTCIEAAMAQLNLARDRAHANIAPALEARVRPLLPGITDGRYLDVMVDPSDLSVKVTETAGAVREARLLSQGTMEQIFLLLRIALSQVIGGSHETAPLILDDVTVQSDQERTIAIMRMLHELSVECQVVLFTQEQEVIDWATENMTSHRDRIVDLAEFAVSLK
ncbi:MAG: AAA family ATPase [Nocardioides sp.]|nr:AAA family ATPase [Nocardioides sp.]